MNLIKLFFLIGVLVSSMSNFFAQVLTPTTKYIPKELPLIRSQDVMWHRRLWREIDLKDKINQHLYFSKNNPNPNTSLFDLILQEVVNGNLNAYHPKDDKFSEKIDSNSILNFIGDSVFSNDTSINKKKVFQPLKSKDVVKLWLKEDWIYDSKYSKIEVRILGVCPLKIKRDEFGQVIGFEQLFWVYFPQLRFTLVNYEAFKKEITDNERVSFDDVFIDRKFDSFIINQNTNNDYHLKDNKTELDKKLEIEKTKNYYFDEVNKVWK